MSSVKKSSNPKTNKFLSAALKEVPRLLGQLNRNPSSRSYGSFDRAYWHYRTNDISCARYQEAVYTLTLLYFSEFEGNIYYKDKKVLEWIRAALRFTTTIERANGSFDEWYVNEGSYVATAFVTSALGQTLLLFREHGVRLDEEDAVLKLLSNSARFLIDSREETVLNQVSGAIFGISCAGYLLGKEEFKSSAASLLTQFLSKQDGDGWWSEYGGPDIGYLTLTVSYLDKYKRLTGDEKVQGAIDKARDFIIQFVNPDFTAGGEYMARNTEYLIPSGTLPYMGAIQPSHLDDRYLSYILYNWIETGVRNDPQPIKIISGESYFSSSGLLRVRSSKYFLTTNGYKGGSFRIYMDGKAYYDSGLEINGFSSGILDRNNLVSFVSGRLESTGVLKKIKEPLLDTKLAIVFKTWQLLFGQVPFLQKTIKKFLRLKMISYSSGVGVRFTRNIKYTKDKIKVTDTIYDKVLEDDIIFGVKSAYNAVPSSKYVATPEVASCQLVPTIEQTTNNGAHVIVRTFHIDG